jgi:O-antigen/teichoic acid export membrane protein
MMIVAIISVAINVILIPKFQAIGASLTVLITNLIMTSLGLAYVFRLIPYRAKDSLIPLGKSLLASFLMAILVYFLKEYLHPLAVMALAIIVYFGLMFLFRGIKREDIMSIRSSLVR